MKVLFARIGYMKFYQGSQVGDERPIGGGKYNKKKIGHEAYNFKNSNGAIYGYFQPHMKSPYKVNLKRIDPTVTDEYINNTLVIFIAKNPIGKGQVIIGWYKDATVYEYILKPEKEMGRGNFGYNLFASHENVVLLPISKRKFTIGHGITGVKEGNPGQANAFYVLDEKYKKKQNDELNSWIDEAINYVKNYEGPTLGTFEDDFSEEIENTSFVASGQGFQSNIVIKKNIENYAMEKCKKYFEKRKFKVKDTSLNKPYDFVVKKANQKLYVEVKGTQSSGEKIILTKNEVEMSRLFGKKMVLFIVHSLKLVKQKVKAGSGETVVLKPWIVNENNLKSISYSYKIS